MPSVVGIILFIFLVLYFVHAVFGCHVYTCIVCINIVGLKIISNIIIIHAPILYTQKGVSYIDWCPL